MPLDKGDEEYELSNEVIRLGDFYEISRQVEENSGEADTIRAHTNFLNVLTAGDIIGKRRIEEGVDKGVDFLEERFPGFSADAMNSYAIGLSFLCIFFRSKNHGREKRWIQVRERALDNLYHYSARRTDFTDALGRRVLAPLYELNDYFSGEPLNADAFARDFIDYNKLI